MNFKCIEFSINQKCKHILHIMILKSNYENIFFVMYFDSELTINNFNNQMHMQK